MNMMIMTFICKMIDNGLGTLKNIYLNKRNYFASSMFSAGSTFFYMVAMVNAIKDNSLWSIIAMCVATFLGSYLPAIMVERMEEDDLYVFEVTSDTYESGLQLIKVLDAKNIPVKTEPAFNIDNEEVITCKIYCKTKAKSALVKDVIINTEFKYHAYVAKEY